MFLFNINTPCPTLTDHCPHIVFIVAEITIIHMIDSRPYSLHAEERRTEVNEWVFATIFPQRGFDLVSGSLPALVTLLVSRIVARNVPVSVIPPVTESPVTTRSLCLVIVIYSSNQYFLNWFHDLGEAY